MSAPPLPPGSGSAPPPSFPSASASASASASSPRGPIAALRRLALLHLDPSSPPPSKSTSSDPLPATTTTSSRPSPFLQLPSRLRSIPNPIQAHSSSLQDDGSFHSALSHNPSFNPDIWPVLPNAFVFPNNSPNNSPPTPSPPLSQQPRADWTTTLGIAVDRQINSFSSLSPPPPRFVSSHLSSQKNRPLSSSPLSSKPSRSRHHPSSHSHKLRSSTYRANLLYGTYTSLARQELEQERAAARKLKSAASLAISLTQPTSSSPHHHLAHSSPQYAHYTSRLSSKLSHHPRPNTASSHARTHSSASTDRLRKTPTSAFFPPPPHQTPFFQKPRKRFRKKTILAPDISLSQSTSSTKDFSGTYNSSNPSPNLSAPASPPSPNPTCFHTPGQATLRLRYQHALSSDLSKHSLVHHNIITPLDPNLHPISQQNFPSLPTLKRLTLPDLVENHPPRNINPTTSTPFEHVSPPPPNRHDFTLPTRLPCSSHSNPSLLLSPVDSIPSNFYSPISHQNPYNQAQFHDNSSQLEFLHPEAGPSNWRERQLEAQQDYDCTRRRYRNLTTNPSDLHLNTPISSNKASKRSTKPLGSFKKHAPAPDTRPWEYQITEQLLIESERSRNNTPISQWSSTSPYHSVKSAPSLDSPSSSDKLTQSSSPRGSSPLSALTPRTQSSASGRVSTLVSVFTDWSRGHQTPPPLPGHSLQSRSSIHGSIAMRDFKSIDSFPRTLATTTSSSNPPLSSRFDHVDEFGMCFKSSQFTSKSHPPPLVQPSSTDSNPLSPHSPPPLLKSPPDSQLRKNHLVLHHKRSKTWTDKPLGRRPNDWTDHDQASLLSPVESCLPIDQSNLCSSNLTTTPPRLIMSDNDDDHHSDSSSAASFHSWHDAPDDALGGPHDQDIGPSPSQSSRASLLHAPTTTLPQPLQSSIAAAIVYDASPLTSLAEGTPTWAHRATQLFCSSPHLTPIAAVPLRPLLKGHSTSYEVHPTTTTTTTKPRGTHKKTNSSPPIGHYTFGSKIALPVLPLSDRIRTQAIFNPRDDPNFLSHPPHQLKRAWKKSQSRVKRALSEPTRPILSRGLYVRSGSGIDEIPAQEPLHHINLPTPSSPPHHRVKNLQNRPETNPVPQLESNNGPSSSHLLPIKGHHHHHHHHHNIIINDVGPDQSLLLTNPLPSDTTNTSSSSHQEYTGFFGSLSLVPINAWCFVFGFVCFPLWYLGSFYPSLQPSKPPPVKFINPQKPSPLTYDVIPDERVEFLKPSTNTAAAATTTTTTTPTTTTVAGPLSGWPTRGHMNQTFSSNSSSNSTGMMTTMIPITPISSSEENRQPDFLRPPNSNDLRALGGFWNEVAPRVDIESALAFDTPIWAYQRAVYTWRLRCRVMAIIFPVLVLPTSIIAVVVVIKTK